MDHRVKPKMRHKKSGNFKSSQVKSMMLTDAGSDERLCPYHSWNTTTTSQ